jgi:serine/threonine protein phosphatase PrpC
MSLADDIRFFAASDVGRTRDHNEDNFLIDGRLALFVVADGMGGHAAGEIASAIAVRVVHEEVRRERALVEAYGRRGGSTPEAAKAILGLLERAVQRACGRVHAEARADSGKRGMGTTLSVLLLAGPSGFIAHVGDSRIYLFRGEKMQQLTEDHTVCSELLRRGKMHPDEIEKVAQKNAITRAVGVYERVEVDTLRLDVLPGDQYLLASDGLHGYIGHIAELEPYLDDPEGERATRELVELANRKGGRDNITAVLVRVGTGDAIDAARARLRARAHDVLEGMSLFSGLGERGLLRILSVTEVVRAPAGEVLVKEGDKGDELFVVLNGLCRVSRGANALGDIGPGEHFGELALVRDLPRSVTVRAVEACELAVIHRGDLFELLRREPELGVRLCWQMVGVLADRLDRSSFDLTAGRVEHAVADAVGATRPEP